MWLDKLRENWIIIASGLVIITFFFVRNHETVEPNEQLTLSENLDATENNGTELALATVDVKGAIENPGVYEVSNDSRINDVIKLAGGFTAEADEMFVNLAQRVQDEMIIVVPLIDENNGVPSGIGNSESKKVKLNYATQGEIETLSGIGPSKAMAIIQYRDEHGFFQNVEDLLEVSGIGEKTLESLKDHIQIP